MTEPKFKVGDVIHNKASGSTKTITHVIFEDSLIKTTWIDGADKYVVEANNYVVLDEMDRATYCGFKYFHDKYKLVSRGEPVNVAEQNTSNKYPHTCDYCGSPCWNGMEFEKKD